jgi:hypothetical protein
LRRPSEAIYGTVLPLSSCLGSGEGLSHVRTAVSKWAARVILEMIVNRIKSPLPTSSKSSVFKTLGIQLQARSLYFSSSTKGNSRGVIVVDSPSDLISLNTRSHYKNIATSTVRGTDDDCKMGDGKLERSGNLFE